MSRFVKTVRIAPGLNHTEWLLLMLMLGIGMPSAWYIGLTAIDKEIAFQDGIRAERCLKEWIPGYCNGLLLSEAHQ